MYSIDYSQICFGVIFFYLGEIPARSTARVVLLHTDFVQHAQFRTVYRKRINADKTKQNNRLLYNR